MKMNDAGLAILKSFEGCKLEAYLDCAGIPTIGYGHTEGVCLGQKITQAQADTFLQLNLGETVDGVRRHVEAPLNENQFSALVCFAYNLGIGTLARSTLLVKVNHHDWEAASNEFLKWDHAGGKQVDGLTRRRHAERDLFLTPMEVPSV